MGMLYRCINHPVHLETVIIAPARPVGYRNNHSVVPPIYIKKLWSIYNALYIHFSLVDSGGGRICFSFVGYFQVIGLSKLCRNASSVKRLPAATEFIIGGIRN